MTVCWLEYHPA